MASPIRLSDLRLTKFERFLSQRSLVLVGIAKKDKLRSHSAENGIPKKLQPLVRLFTGLEFSHHRTVGHRLFVPRAIAHANAKLGFDELTKFR